MALLITYVAGADTQCLLAKSLTKVAVELLSIGAVPV